ncbi:hypothetical protein EV715DRAFT_268221 [Schizophyllum commune]
MLIPATVPSLARSPSVQSLATDDMSTLGSSVANKELTSNASQAHRFYLQDGNIRFELDDGAMYNVHHYFFETYAPKFADEHLRDQTLSDDSTIIKLPNVSNVDFERFLSIIYPTTLGKCDISTVPEWTSVLRLATRWGVASLRDLAIQELQSKASDPLDKIAIAREFGLGPAWLAPAFAEICTRPERLTRAEAERLGLHSVLEVGWIWEELARRAGNDPPFDVLGAVRASEALMAGGQGEARNAGQSMEPSSSSPVYSDGTGSALTTPPTPPSVDPASSSPLSPLSPSPTMPSPPVTPDAHSQNSTLSEISDQLAYLTLQSAEIAEEAKYTGTPMNRALFALHLARSIAKESSPAALRHREWRQTRVRRLARDPCIHLSANEKANEIQCAGKYHHDDLNRVETRLANLIRISASGLAEPGTGDASDLLIQTSNRSFKDWIKSVLDEKGWSVKETEKMYLSVSIPLFRFRRGDSSVRIQALIKK